MRAFGHPTSTALTISASLAQIGEFSFIIAGLGVALQILPKEGQSLVLAGALVSIMLNPLVFGLLDRWQAKQEQLPQPPEPEEATGPSRDLHDHAIVIGYGRVGSELAQVLRDRGVPVLVIDDNKEHVEQAHAKGLAAIRGSAAADRVLAEAHPERAKIAVLAIPQPLEAGEALAKLRAINPDLTLLARAQRCRSEASAGARCRWHGDGRARAGLFAGGDDHVDAAVPEPGAAQHSGGVRGSVCRACSPAPAEATATATAEATATACIPWDGGVGPVAGDAVNPSLGAWQPLARVRCPAHTARPGLGVLPNPPEVYLGPMPRTLPQPDPPRLRQIPAICRNGVLLWWVSTLVDTAAQKNPRSTRIDRGSGSPRCHALERQFHRSASQRPW